tara:strand:- start:4286 stop:5131 length:846 start_codon:yes stop_codon:yes gene_type:complete
VFKNTASQKLTVLAFADAGHAALSAGEKVTGDAANITMKVEQDDDGVRTASNDTNPTETEDGQYTFDLTQAESNGDKLTFYPESSTAGVQVVALPSNVIYPRPANFTSLGIEADGDLTRVDALSGHTAQSGDTYAIANGDHGLVSIQDDIDTLVSRVTGNVALASVLGERNDAAAAGDPTATDTLMQYVKQLINIMVGSDGIPSFPTEAAPANNVSLAEVLRAIHADVSSGTATAAKQDEILEDLVDIKGTGFVKDTNSLVDLSASSATNIQTEGTVIESD